MKVADFEKITKRIQDAYRDPFTEGQFNEWYKGFAREDYCLVDQAVTLMTGPDGYKYFPAMATLWVYICKAKEVQKAKEEAGALGEKVYKPTPRDRDRDKSWARYFLWIVESKEYPKTSEDVMELKTKFEKEHSNWQPENKGKKETTKPEPIKDILDGAFAETWKKEV